MKEDMTFEDYASYRKAYIEKARRGFDTGGFEQEEDDRQERDGLFFAKLRLLAAMLLFIGFLYCWYTDTSILGHSAQSVINIVEDNSYFELLKDYIKVIEK